MMMGLFCLFRGLTSGVNMLSMQMLDEQMLGDFPEITQSMQSIGSWLCAFQNTV